MRLTTGSAAARAIAGRVLTLSIDLAFEDPRARRALVEATLSAFQKRRHGVVKGS
jgi:hypothetical protein